MDYLEQRNRFVAGDASPEKPITAAGKHVVIIGGGDTGADCLGNAHREHPASIAQFELLPEPPPERPDDITPWPQWPLILRTSGAHEEGGDRVYSVMTTELTGAGDRLKELHFHEVGPPPNFEKIEGSERTIPADLVLLAMGFLHPQHEGLLEQLGVDLDERGNIGRDASYASSVDGVFVAGDAGRGQSLIVWAIAEGRAAAAAVDRYLTGDTSLPSPIPPTARPLVV
jgi:glutamate synthase (NADPH) small chain